MTCVVTTFSKDGYDLYGHKMIETWIRFWPKKYQLLVYVEDYSIIEKDDRIHEIKISESCPDLLEFKAKSEKMASMVTDKKELTRIQKTVKWSHKVFVISHALNNISSDYFIFLDGDTYTKSQISETLDRDLVKHHLIAVHFERILNNELHFETGLIAFNNNHHQMPLFRKMYTSGYNNLEIYNMKKTWDGFWLPKLTNEYKFDVLDLSIGKLSGVFGNPLIHNKIIHDVGTKKYLTAGYNKFTGKKNESR